MQRTTDNGQRTHNLAAHFQLRDDITFLNHGSFGACPRPVFAVYQQWQRELEADPVDFFARRLRPLLAEARGQLATFLGTQADHVVFVPNATFGLNIIAQSLVLNADDEILSTNHEYGAVDRTWTYVCERQGARLVHQRLELPFGDATDIVEQLWAGVTPRTRIISLSHITSPTALRFPIKAICERARDAGILTVIDGAHAPGQIDLALDDLHADFYVGNCHKWLCAPKGSGFLYAHPARQALLEPLVVGWGWRAHTPGPSLFLDYFEQLGTNDLSAYLSVPAAIDFQAQHDWQQVRADCHTLLADAQQQICALTGLAPISEGDQWWTQMCSIPLPPECDQTLGQQLWEKYQIEVPIVQWEGQTFIRVSIQAYNTPSDVATLVGALRELLREQVTGNRE